MTAALVLTCSRISSNRLETSQCQCSSTESWIAKEQSDIIILGICLLVDIEVITADNQQPSAVSTSLIADLVWFCIFQSERKSWEVERDVDQDTQLVRGLIHLHTKFHCAILSPLFCSISSKTELYSRSKSSHPSPLFLISCGPRVFPSAPRQSFLFLVYMFPMFSYVLGKKVCGCV